MHPGGTLLEVYGVGIDAVDLEHFFRTLKTRPEFAKFVFTRREYRRYRLRPQSLAARLGVKEAFLKAAGTEGGIRLREIETLSDCRGKPYVVLHGRAYKWCRHLGVRRVLVSMSHSRKTAIAQVILIAGSGRARERMGAGE